MPTYLVEAYTPTSGANQADTAHRIARAAAELAREGIRVAHRRTTFLVEDDTSFHLVEATSTTAVSELCHRAGLGRVRIVPPSRRDGGRRCVLLSRSSVGDLIRSGLPRMRVDRITLGLRTPSQ